MKRELAEVIPDLNKPLCRHSRSAINAKRPIYYVGWALILRNPTDGKKDFSGSLTIITGSGVWRGSLCVRIEKLPRGRQATI